MVMIMNLMAWWKWCKKFIPPLSQHDEIDRLERLLQSKSSDLAILTEAAGVFHHYYTITIHMIKRRSLSSSPVSTLSLMSRLFSSAQGDELSSDGGPPEQILSQGATAK